MAIDLRRHWGGTHGGRDERGGAFGLLVPVALGVDGLLLLLVGRGGSNPAGSGRRAGAGPDSRRRRWRNRRRVQGAAGAASPAEGTPGPGPPRASVVEHLASLADIGIWLSPGLGGTGRFPEARR